MYVPFDTLPEESKFGYINRIENFLMKKFKKLKRTKILFRIGHLMGSILKLLS